MSSYVCDNLDICHTLFMITNINKYIINDIFCDNFYHMWQLMRMTPSVLWQLMCITNNNLYMYTVATPLIIWYLHFTHKLLLAQNVFNVYASGI